MPLSRRARTVTVLALAAASGLGLSACGDNTANPAMSGEPTTTTTEAPPTTEAETELEVTGVDYRYEGLPAEVAVDTDLVFKNGSDKEPHELILARIKDDETRSIAELLALPEDEVAKAIDVKGVSVAAEPGGDGAVVDGNLTVDEPGRYVAVCFIPVGTQPQVYIDAAEAGTAPEADPNAGPPHFTQGMVQEFTAK